MHGLHLDDGDDDEDVAQHDDDTERHKVPNLGHHQLAALLCHTAAAAGVAVAAVGAVAVGVSVLGV